MLAYVKKYVVVDFYDKSSSLTSYCKFFLWIITTLIWATSVQNMWNNIFFLNVNLWGWAKWIEAKNFMEQN